ncbi:TRAP transporter large permease [Salicibibacter cibarius]|uniref:TRAP transporter large permease n=1 Tax=Salicibibacter cibarius TaxID=2743000 RepID=A0A7T6Z2G9_9BACI|nr:TRAP transporter large permease [Salicibibacter cibarius]QQK75736.1 TRAP transporter large permease [Salicibibacter cibarius]
MVTILFVSLVVLLFLGVPVAIAMGLASGLALLVDDTPLMVIAQRAFVEIDSFPLMAIPLFMLAGVIMQYGGLSQRLINFANALTGHISGGISIVTIVATMFFAAISGSGVAATATLGAILIPAMVERSYHKEFAGSVQGAAGTLGIVIPPSIPIILYGVAAGDSVGDLFVAGLVPGILMGLGLIIVVMIVSKKRDYPKESVTTKQELGKTFLEAVPALIMPIIVLGGIYSGIFTATEAAGVAVAYSFLVSAVFYKSINKKNIGEVLTQSSITSAGIMFILAGAGFFGWILTRENIPQQVAGTFTALSDNPIVFLTVVMILLLIIGMFMETNASIVILAPILAPVATELGIDPIHFGIVVIVTLSIGMITPPFGMNLFIVCKIANARLDQVAKSMIPFYVAILVILAIIAYIPSVSIGLLELFE